MTVARFKNREVAGEEKLDWYWIVGEAGAVSTWFSDMRPVIGHAVCDGISLHSPRALDDFDAHEACPFIESGCWWQRGSMLWLDGLIAHYEAGEDDPIYEYLVHRYNEGLAGA